MDAYCLNCRIRRGMKATKTITWKNGKLSVQGTCKICGAKMFTVPART